MSIPLPDPQFLIPRQFRDTDPPIKSTDRFYPLVKSDGATIRLARNEMALWHGKANVSEYHYSDEFDDYDRLWELPKPANILITNKRITFLCEKWTVGGGWRSHGTAPLTTALINTASKLQAAKRGRGTVMAGHCRWEWPARIAAWPQAQKTPRQNSQAPSILLAAKAAPPNKGYHTLRFGGADLASTTAVEQVGNTIIRALISHRLAHASLLELEHRELKRLSEMNEKKVFSITESQGGQTFGLPGRLFIGFMARSEYATADVRRILDKRED